MTVDGADLRFIRLAGAPLPGIMAAPVANTVTVPEGYLTPAVAAHSWSPCDRSGSRLCENAIGMSITQA